MFWKRVNSMPKAHLYTFCVCHVTHAVDISKDSQQLWILIATTVDAAFMSWHFTGRVLTSSKCLLKATLRSRWAPPPFHVLSFASHVSVLHALTFCIKCVSVGQRSLRHMQSAHARGGFSPRSRISTSNTPAQMKVRGVTLKQGEKTELEGHASPKEPHAFSIGSLSGTTQVTWAGRMWVWEVWDVLSLGWGAQVLTVRPCTQSWQDLLWILHYRIQHGARARPETLLHRQRSRQWEGTAESSAHLTELGLYFAHLSPVLYALLFILPSVHPYLWLFHRFRPAHLFDTSFA